MRLIAFLLLIAAVACSASVAFAACNEGGRQTGASARAGCAKPKKFEPYDPDRVRSGSRPGFFNIGNGTEVRVSGRARVEYQYTR